MQAFHNDSAVKAKYLARVEHHIAADNLVRGSGWSNGRGCAVGCTLEAYDHSRYPVELGIPEWLARVEDTLFEGMSVEKSRTWPRVFLEAINVGADIEKAEAPFLIMVLRSTLDIFDHEVLASVNSVITLWERDDIGSDDWVQTARILKAKAWGLAWGLARSSAEAAAWAAEAAETWTALTIRAKEAASEAVHAAALGVTAKYDSFADGLVDILRGIK